MERSFSTRSLPCLSRGASNVASKGEAWLPAAQITFLLSKKTTVDEVNAALVEGAKSMPGIMAVTREPIVSSDIVGRPESSIVDFSLTQVVDGDMVKIFALYDMP